MHDQCDDMIFMLNFYKQLQAPETTYIYKNGYRSETEKKDKSQIQSKPLFKTNFWVRRLNVDRLDTLNLYCERFSSLHFILYTLR